MQNKSDYIGPKDGFSLVEMLVGVAIMGIIAFGIQKAFESSFFTSKKMAESRAVDEVQRLIRISLDCPATITGMASKKCPTAVVLRKKNGDDIFPSLPGGIDKVEFKCTKDISDMQFSVYLTGDKEAKSLFTEVPFGC